MNLATHSRVPSLTEAARFSPQEVVDLASALTQYIEALKHQLDWFKRQVFGQKSERRFIDGNDGQLSLGAMLEPAPTATAPVPTERVVASHSRRAPKQDDAEESLSFFDATRVPMELIELIAPEAQGLSPDAFEVIGHKDSYRMAQRPASAVVLHFRRPVIKLKVSQAIVCASAPAGVIEGSRADVSLLAGLLVDKFAYHLPLYRQHQRLADAGITVSRPWLTQIAQQSIALLEPIYDAQFEAIRRSRVKAMDETPIKAGRAGPGKLKAAYFWPVYGQQDEVCFPFFETRRAVHGEQALGLTHAEGAVLLSDGYAAYAQYATKTGLTHAQCWAHTRRKFFEAQDIEPAAASHALALIGKIYAVEEHLRTQPLSTAKKLDDRLMHAKPLVEQFFAWVHQQCEAQGLLPNNPLTKALAYARERRLGLEVTLNDPEVPIDTNHLERALRAIPMGRNDPSSTMMQGSRVRDSEAQSRRRLQPH